MKSRYFLHSSVKEALYFEEYYYNLLKQPCKYKVLKEGYKPSVWYIEKLEERCKYVSLYRYVSLRPYKKGEAIAIL